MASRHQPVSPPLPEADYMNPYFLHPSDNPGLVFVSQPLTGDNYGFWSRAMKIALSVKNKTGFIDGSLPRPDDDSPLLRSWIRNNDIVISWILNSVSEDISTSILYSDSAYEIWKDLQDRFQQSNTLRIFQLRRDLMSLRQDQQSVSVYFTKLKSLWEELASFRLTCNCGACHCGGVKNLADFHQMEYTMAFLTGLNDSFAQLRGQILLMDPLPPINEVFSMVLQEERQRSILPVPGADPVSTMAFAAKRDSGFKNPCKDRPLCSHCKIHGHTVDCCYKLHGYTPGFKPKSKGTGSTNSVNQASTQVACEHVPSTDSFQSFFAGLDPAKCSQLMSLLSTHMASTSLNAGANDIPVNAVQTGDVKKLLAHKTGFQSEEQQPFFKGKEEENEGHLHMEGVEDKSELLPLEDATSKERKLEETRKHNEMLKASEAVAGVRAEVDQLSERVSALEVAVDGGTMVSDKEFVASTELLMRQLVKLDGIEAEGEVKLQRKAEVRRVQNFVDRLDSLKARNSNPFSNIGETVSLTNHWEPFDSGMGSLDSPT